MFGKLGGYNTMAKTTFSGPVKSQRDFKLQELETCKHGAGATTLTVASHAGKVIKVNDADGAIYS